MVTDSFKGRSVFITGHTGFKGSWLAIWLHRLGAEVSGYSLPPPTKPSNFEASFVRKLLSHHYDADIRDCIQLHAAMRVCSPDVVFHLAAQTLVRQSYRDPLHTLGVNVMGTASLLEAVRELRRPCVVIAVTSDKCYENSGPGRPHVESDPFGGHDPYSASKAATEILIAAYRQSFFPPEDLGRHGVKLASVRAGNVIGGGDWAAERIVPDIVRALAANEPVPIRNPSSIRPWQHVLEPLCGYLTLASRMLASDDPRWSSGWNFGPPARDEVAVREVVEPFCQRWGSMGWEDMSRVDAPYEEQALRLSTGKAANELGWQSRWSLAQAVERTCRWYQAFYAQPDRSTYKLCAEDIADYEANLSKKSPRSDRSSVAAHASSTRLHADAKS
ncbi:MAG: CDP-glucose 4,6-dehydratase [Terriglobia bacterium]